MAKGFKPPHKNDARKIKLGKVKGARVNAETNLPRGIALPERNKKKQKQLERYAKICAREAAAKAAPPRDVKMG